jgi:hypothetical protein
LPLLCSQSRRMRRLSAEEERSWQVCYCWSQQQESRYLVKLLSDAPWPL